MKYIFYIYIYTFSHLFFIMNSTALFYLQCICPTGMRYNTQNQMCEDVDECEELGPDVCFNGVCINTPGAYECECSPGYILDNTGHICMGTKKNFQITMRRFPVSINKIYINIGRILDLQFQTIGRAPVGPKS